MNRKLKIVLYTQGLPFTGNTLDYQPLGGAETAFIYVARELAKLGNEVKAFCQCSDQGLYDNVHYQDISHYDEWRKKEECDLFICSRFYQVFYEPIKAGIKVLWLHDHMSSDMRPYLAKALGAIDYIYCLSQYHARYIESVLPELSSKLKITFNGIDLTLIDAIRQKSTSKKHKMMFTSRPERGLEEALKIYAHLGDKNLEFLACTYPYPNEQIGGKFLPLLQAFMQEGYNVKMGQFNKEALYRHIAESKVVIYPANTPEIFCISAVEAQACGTVFLARELGALNETVGYPSQKSIDFSGFVRATKQVLENVNFRKSLEEMGLQHVRKYSWSKVAKQFVEEAIRFTNNRHKVSLSGKVETKPISKMYSSSEGGREPIIDPVFKIPKKDLPKISCLTVFEDQIVPLKETIQSFKQQTYPNKELIIVSAGSEYLHQAIVDYVNTASLQAIRVFQLLQKHDRLEFMREIVEKKASGDILCNWKANDLSHPDRLSVQYSVLANQKAEACYVSDFLHFFAKQARLFWVDQKIEIQSLMIQKEAYLTYPISPWEKDNKITFFHKDLLSPDLKAAELKDYGFLYLHRTLDRNDQEIERLLQQAISTSRAASLLKKSTVLLFNALKYYPLPQPVSIMENSNQSFFIYMQNYSSKE